MGQRKGLWSLLAIGAVMAMPRVCQAAAWTEPQGSGQSIVTVTASRADEAFDASGHRIKASRYEKLDLQAFTELGVTDRLSLILSPGLQHVAIGTGSGERTGNPDYAEFGGRYRLMQGREWVISAQATMRTAGRSGKASTTAVDDTATEIDLRALLGYSFEIARHSAFIDVEAAHRFRSGAEPDEVHAEATFGYRPASKWLLLVQSFNVISEGGGQPGFPAYDYFKLEPSAVYQVSKRLGLQAGGFTTFSGRNAISENGLVLASFSYSCAGAAFSSVGRYC